MEDSNLSVKREYNRAIRILRKYFVSSIKTLSTALLIAFNLFVLYDLVQNEKGIIYALFFFLVQLCLYLFFFGITVFSLKKFNSQGKTYTEKGTKSAAAKLALGILVFYGIALGILFYGLLEVMSSQRMTLNMNIDIYFIIGILILLSSVLLNFIGNFSKERERIGKSEITKVFFEPAGKMFPIYLSMVFLGILGPLIIVLKIFGDVIINSPLNSESPIINELLGKDRGIEKIRKSRGGN